MLSFLDWFDAIRYRWRLVAMVTAILAGLAVLFIAIAPKSYTASASLLLDTRGPDPLKEGTEGTSENNSRAMMATQADLVRSPTVAARVAASTGLIRDPEYLAEWESVTGRRIPFADWLNAELLENLEVTPGKDTNVLLINAKARDPERAAALASGFAEASVASSYRLRTEPAKAYANWLATRVGASRGNVVQAQNALSNFVKATGITNGGDLSSEGQQMAEVATQLASAEARAAAARQSAFSGAQGRGDAERSVTIQQLRQQVAEKSGKLADLQALFGPEYPDVRRTQAEVATLQSRLNSEVASATTAFSSAREAQASAERQAAAASESRLRALSGEQRSRVLAMGGNLAEYSRLRNEFEGAQRNYNDLNQRLARMRLQGNVPQTEVQVLDKASVPLFPSSPKAGLTLALSILLGALLGAAAAVFLEFRNPRVRSWAGIERMLGVQVVGRVALPDGSARGPLLLTSGAQ